MNIDVRLLFRPMALSIVFGVFFVWSPRLLAEEPCIPIPVPANMQRTFDVDDSVILPMLNESGKSFYLQSKTVRATYAQDHPYKHFILTNFSLQQMDEEGYFHQHPIRNCYVPNPFLYGSAPRKIPPHFFRYVKDCASRKTIQRQVIDTSVGYKNYIGGDRYDQQCIGDGTFDNYYVEGEEKLE